MATLLLTAGAAVLTSGAAAWVTTAVGALATVVGGYIDARLFGSGAQKSEGPRLDSLQVQASTEGAPIPEIAGRVRLAGQIIWATKFREVAKTEKQGGKGGGGGVETTTYSYYANFAVALSEGTIDRIGRIWADGKPLDPKGVTMRVSGTTVLRMIAVTSPAVTYTAAEQTADFAAPQPAITLKVYQLSAAIGRGWPAIAIL